MISEEIRLVPAKNHAMDLPIYIDGQGICPKVEAGVGRVKGPANDIIAGAITRSNWI